MLAMKKDIKSMELAEIETEFLEFGLKKYKAFQVFKWLSEGAIDFLKMTNISKEDQKFLFERYEIPGIFIDKKIVSNDGTAKYLLQLDDGSCIESVLMEYKYGFTACVSVQVGCRMGCRFCANSGCKFIRNLRASEIISQIHAIQNEAMVRVSNVTLMGIGEPFDNYENVIKSLRLMIFDRGMKIGARHISISTCGIVPQILRFAEEGLGCALSVSLHAADNEKRNKIMPVASKYKIEEIIEACRVYFEKTKRRVSFEYIMISGVNDSFGDATRLAKIIRGMPAHVNLIPANDTGNGFLPSSRRGIEIFAEILLKSGVNVTTRRTLGADINASCGQLRVALSAHGGIGRRARFRSA